MIDKDRYDTERGFYLAENNHKFDKNLACAILDFCHLRGFKSAVDLGCGWSGLYTKFWSAGGLDCQGYDGNPLTGKNGEEFLHVLDLTRPLTEWIDEVDVSICLEVGEHIPKQYEGALFRNILKPNPKYVILSWAIPNQVGNGHVNQQANRYVKSKMAEFGWGNDLLQEGIFRSAASLRYFKNTVMCFHK